MKIEQALKGIFQFKEALPEIFSTTEVTYAFGENRPNIGDDSNAEYRGFLGGDKIGQQSGLYIFTTEENEVLYIGKATKNNLHHRVWSHVRKPTRLENGRMTFPNLSFSFPERPELEKSIRNGNGKLHVVTVSNPDVISLIEVYLQMLYKKNYGRLPPFNKQIG